jgi:hypothetical protein
VNFWETVYIQLDYLNKLSWITQMYITKVYTVVLVFHEWDSRAQAHDTLKRYCYIFSDGSIAYGQ